MACFISILLYFIQFQVKQTNNIIGLYCEWHEKHRIKSLFAIICLTINSWLWQAYFISFLWHIEMLWRWMWVSVFVSKPADHHLQQLLQLQSKQSHDHHVFDFTNPGPSFPGLTEITGLKTAGDRSALISCRNRLVISCAIWSSVSVWLVCGDKLRPSRGCRY